MLIPPLLVAQEQIKGGITDNNSNVISYASIGYFNHRIGTITDSNGHFWIQKIVGDSIKISMVGYNPQVIKIDTDTDSIFIQLEKLYMYLSDVSVVSRSPVGEKVDLGFYNFKSNFNNLLTVNLQEATFIPNTNHIRGFVDQIKFKLRDFSNKHFFLRIRLYNKNPKDGMPFEDLLISENIINPTDLKHRNKFSVKNKNIQLPYDGVFVSFEWLPTETKYKNEKVPYLIGNSVLSKNFRYQNFKDTKWFPSVLGLIPGNYEAINVSVTISY